MNLSRRTVLATLAVAVAVGATFGLVYALVTQEFNLSITGTVTVELVSPEADADVNGDGVVDGADLRIVASNIGVSPPDDPRADVNGDGVVDVLDLVLVALYFGQTPPGPIPPPAGMVAWWPGDDHANDIIDGNDGTPVGGATYAPGMVGQAFSFDGSGDSGVTVPSSPSLNMTEAVTIDAWVYPTSFPNAFPTVVRRHRCEGGACALGFAQYLLAVTDQGQAHCNINASGSGDPIGGTVPLNEWTHLACTYDRVNVRVYVNGAEVASDPLAEAIISSPLPLGIGIAPGFTSRNFDGLIDEVEIFNRALTAAEIQAIYDAGNFGKIKPAPPSPGEPVPLPVGMVSWWPGDGSPSDIVDGNPGILVGGATYTGGMVDQAFSFDGVADYLDIGNPPNLNISGDMTVDFWFRIDSQKYNVLAAKGIGLAGNEWYVRQRGDTGAFLEWAFEDTGGNFVFGATSSPIGAGSFHHLALVRSGTSGRLYLDGVQIDSDTEAALGDISNPHDLLIGADNRLGAGDFAAVTIDEVEIFSRALRGEEIRTIYNAGSAGKIKPPPAPIPPPAGMVSWWPGDDHPNDIIDGNHATLEGDTTYAPGMVGQAFSFDGSGDLVLVPASANLNIVGDVTVDFWAKRAVFGLGFMVTKGAGGIGGVDVPTAFEIRFNSDDRLRGLFERADGSFELVTGPPVTDTDFHHYAYVRSGSTHELFIDGVSVASETFTGSPGDTSGIPLVIGAYRSDTDPTGFQSYFGGIIDEVEIFNRALTDAEIKDIYDAGSLGKVKPPPPEPIEPPGGMVSWWPGDGHTTDIIDGNHGTLSGGATYTGGKVGQAFGFDGANDSVIVAHDSSLNPTDFTFDAWMKPSRTTPADWQAIITKNIGPRSPSLWLFGDNVVHVYFDPVGLVVASTTELTLDEWHHVAATYDGSAANIYINGVLNASAAVATTPATNTQPMHFGAGRDNNTFFFQGQIDEVEVFNRALTAAEVKAIYDAGSLGKIKPPPPVESDILSFSLENHTVPVGTTVVWTNQSGSIHTTTSGVPGAPTGTWDSGFLSGGGQFEFTFDAPGAFPYYCTLHPGSMQATITVE